jgi:hypothetical protein
MSGEPPSAPQQGGGYGAWGPPPSPTPPGPSKPPSWRTPHPYVVVAIVVVVVLAFLALSAKESTDEGSSPAVVEVVAPAGLCWSGAFGDRTVDGCGNASVPLQDMGGTYSANAQKQDDTSQQLTLVLRIDGQEVDRTSTSAAYGLASVVGQR